MQQINAMHLKGFSISATYLCTALKPHEFYMARCLQLASKGAGLVSPNPMVGSVIVHEGTEIASGWHQKYGENHAERNAILSIAGDPRLKESTLYVNLEPCAHHGKTPPCADLIVASGILKVVVGCRDPFPEVNGKGIEKLRQQGIDVTVPVLEQECLHLNRRFFTRILKNRPYVILKWAQTLDGFMAPATGERYQISGAEARNRLHQWRATEDAILVGAGTLVADKPQLTVRFAEGRNPRRIFFDPQLRGTGQAPTQTTVFNRLRDAKEGLIQYVKSGAESFIPDMLQYCQTEGISSVLVEGGPETLNRFIAAGMYDEIRIFTSKSLQLQAGLKAPALPEGGSVHTEDLSADTLTTSYFVP